MVLNNVTTINGTGICFKLASTEYDALQIDFTGAIAFPGLINSHDHLDFNLFPKLGNRLYSNYTEWGKYIHQEYKAEIAAVLKVPENLRVEWGIYKNLLGGVTTVVNHGKKVNATNAPITVFENCQNLHSVKFQKYWKLKLNASLNKKIPVAIHVGEGIDTAAHDEINELVCWNIFNRKLIGVHAVAMSGKQAEKFEALVWCPESNYFLLNKTADIPKLKSHTQILFGTDSTLTGDWNIWDHIRLAQKTNMLTDIELYNSLLSTPAGIWGINNHSNLVVAKNKHQLPFLESFYATDPEDILLVVHQGNIRLFDDALSGQLSDIDKAMFSKITINGTCKYVRGNLPGLLQKIHGYNPAASFPVTA